MIQPGKMVFVSYAREDAVAARRIADALGAFGVEVWLDQSELRGGDAWDASIREQIRGCTLFVPLISAQTQARREGYFRREWKLAADRTHDMAEGLPFIIPVIIDATPEGAALVPDEFKRVHITRLAQGVPTTDFVERIRKAIAPEASATRAGAAAPAILPARSPRATHAGRWVAAMLVVAAFGLAAFFWFKGGRETPRNAIPVVLLMDSPFVERVYDPATLKSGGTNADDITDALRDLPVTLIKENTSSTWHREPEILKVHPDLVVLHRSCFQTFPAEKMDEVGPLLDNKLVAFLGYLATVNPRVKFIVYSRHSFEKDSDAAEWKEASAVRFPALAGRIETWRVPLDRATFRHPVTAQELRTSVEKALGLRFSVPGK